MSSSKALKKSLHVLGNVTLNHVKTANGSSGTAWLGAIDTATATVMTQYPNITGIQISGAKAHQSSTVAAHGNVISTKYFDGEQKVVSGHIFENGYIEFNKAKAAGSSSKSKAGSSGKAKAGSSGKADKKAGGWKPTREAVDQKRWTIYDTDKKKNRPVLAESDGWWYIERGGVKEYF